VIRFGIFADRVPQVGRKPKEPGSAVQKRPYVALIGDMVASRELEPRTRARLQTLIQATLERHNRVLDSKVLAARLQLTQGDEIQGLFRASHAARVVEVVRELSESLFQHAYPPPRVRFGIGRGALSTGALPRPWAPNPALLDGPAFHLARGALERARDLERWVCFGGIDADHPERGDDHVDRALEALFAFMGAIRDDWTRRQGAISIRFREGISQTELAAVLKVSPSVVSETLKSARHTLLIEGEEAAAALLAAAGARP
jgi:DNA-binding CsgD family transcriptional regulator